ncbi:heavy metal-associated isoprenylated plant protein 26-like [Hibiscus syriacus]|uniref:Heavy metal-associated isoprenylated plant protein 26-like n=1 Tax=Hibiscus syriacus TaxID=106335 RepID=A0A6A2ZZS6_HIBSY|nr:trafficking protein particle complex subunit 12-like [Hibiscus syriacus]KAE8697388.1 heavy metal-associated isoprenylated plant protein 26-like [Hibiscus syriacus]
MEEPSPSPDPPTNQFGSLNDLAHELASLEDLATRGSWRSILDKVSRARSLNLLTSPHDHLIYLSYNVLAFSKLRRFSEASNEIDTLDDFNSNYYKYETYPRLYPNRSGSMIPFSLRFIHAQLPIKLGNRQEGLDRFYLLLKFIREKIKEKESNNLRDSVRIWKRRENSILNCLIGHHLGDKEFSLCLDLIKDLINRDYLDPVLVSKLGYIQMQIGDIEGAKGSFNRVETMLNEKRSYEYFLGEVQFRNLVNRNKALVYLVGKDYVSAVREYEECIERDHTDVVALNNKALCLMYLRDLSDSIKLLEKALERIPTIALDETLVINLCSMYELAYVNHSEIKRTLNNWIVHVAPDDFDASCTRV